MENPLITVVICTHNHAPALEKTLAALGAIQAPDALWELLIVDNASTDDTSKLLSESNWKLPGISCRAVHEENLGVAHARNRGLREATGEYVLFLDDDETPAPDWLVQMVSHITTTTADAIGGRIEIDLDGCEWPKWLHGELPGFLGQLHYGTEHHWLEQFTTPIFTGNAAFLKNKALELGGFDVNLGRRGGAQTGGEDTDMYRRMLTHGCRILWAPDALIYHRIEKWKLRKSYFLDLHYRQGRMEGARKRGANSRVPPAYLWPQVARAYLKAFGERLRKGSDHSLRLEMNAAYFTGYVMGWIRDTV